MRKVVLESPYAGNVELNTRYARACLRDCLVRGEAPVASHLLYTQQGVLDDTIAEERSKGIRAGLVWGELAEASVFYMDLGMTPGMVQGLAAARECGRVVELRHLPSEDMERLNE